MILSHQFCTAQQAQQLKKLGMRQDTNFFFMAGQQGPFAGRSDLLTDARDAAITAAEAITLLPVSILYHAETYRLTIWKELANNNANEPFVHHLAYLGHIHERQRLLLRLQATNLAQLYAAAAIEILTAHLLPVQYMNAWLGPTDGPAINGKNPHNHENQ